MSWQINHAPLVSGPAGNTAIIIGDSIAASDGGWCPWASALSGSRFRLMRYNQASAIAGNTSRQMLDRIAADVIAYAPTWCIIQGVTPNDNGAGIPVATSVQNIKDMAGLCVAAGIRPVIVTAPPSDTAANLDHMLSVAFRVREWADRNEYPVIDIYPPTADTDGSYQAAYTADGTHPNDAGNLAIASYVATRLPAAMAANSSLTWGSNDDTNLVAGGLFLTNTAGLGTGWASLGAGPLSIGAGTAGQTQGNWQVIGADAPGTQVYQGVSTVVGNVYELTCRIKKDAVPGLLIRCAGDPLGGYKAAGVAITEAAGAIATHRFVATSTSHNILFGAQGASGTCAFAQVAIRNLTALGIAA